MWIGWAHCLPVRLCCLLSEYFLCAISNKIASIKKTVPEMTIRNASKMTNTFLTKSSVICIKSRNKKKCTV